MAKTTGPLMSESSSGTFGHTITFDRRGIAHKPNNPGAQRTASRGNDRQIFLAISRSLARCAPIVRAAIRTAIAPDPNWRAWMTDAISGKHHTTWDAVTDLWIDQLSSTRTAWQSAAIDAGFDQVSLVYATNPAITAGLQMWQLASTLFVLDLNTESGAPAAGNAQAWANYITNSGGELPANALTLNGEALTLAGEILTL